MPATLTLTLNSTQTPIIGQVLYLTATSSAANWDNTDNTNPLTITGPANCALDYVLVNTSSQCLVCVYTGDSNPGTITITITDTVNSCSATISVSGTIAKRAATGVTWYVQGGIPNPAAPLLTVTGAGGSTTYLYQIIALNAKGKTRGMTAALVNLGNIPADTTFDTVATIQQYNGQRISVINNAPDALNGTNYVVLTWPAIAGATGYDVIRSTNGSTWVSLATNQSGTTFNDQGGSTSAYTLPSANNTSTGSNSNAGTSAGAAFATLAKAMSVASAGDQVIVAGFVCDTAAVACVDRVNIVGTDRFSSRCYADLAASNTSHAAYRMPSYADVSEISFECDIFNQPIIGALTADSPTIDCHLYGVRAAGNTNSFRFSVAGCSAYCADCLFTSTHGTFGMTGSFLYSTVNMDRCTMYARGSFQTSGGGTIAMICNQGFLCCRDTRLISNIDSQNAPSWRSYAIIAGGQSARLINVELFGVSAELSSNTPNNLILNNTVIDPVKNSLASATGITSINAGVYQVPPLLAGTASTAKGNSVSLTGGFNQ